MFKNDLTAIAVLALVLSTFDAFAQTPSAAPAPGTLVKSDESRVLTTADILEMAKASRAKGATDLMVSTNAIAQPPYRLNVEHRIAGTTPPSIHERNNELFIVVDGEGVLITGGNLADPVRRNATNIAGTSITGGQSRPIRKGDILFVPAGTPHQIADVKGTLTMVITMLAAPTP